MFKITAKVEGLKCPNCERHINEAIKEAFSIKKVTASHTDKEVVITSKEDIDNDKLTAVVAEAGYEVMDIQKETYKTFLGL